MCYNEHMKLHRGFTIVELLIVIVVIATLASVTFALFTNAQMSSRDSARKNNVKTLGTLLDQYYDRNGFYPTGCGGTSCINGSILYTPSPDNLSASTTTAQASTILGQDISSLLDPNDRDVLPFIGSTSTVTNQTPGYIYRGAYTLNPSWTGSITQNAATLVEAGTSRQCSVSYNMTSAAAKPYDTTSYLLAYYAEASKTWQIYPGKHGVQPSIDNGATAGFCNIVN